ncbi:ABC transporter permease [Nocardioides baekrokdamisoli]|uniref:ABC transporter permease n=1 Tax=Nocardioides baekrokdamisoli TaxID=1804624 RepID=A0A3G9J2V3_9ACTN|nr:iron ABC transporter permease [Nocardioides baekrokdamisoli]BBH17774.1 ABC transporter permease [Nocardioides baekrokdamisoli]
MALIVALAAVPVVVVAVFFLLPVSGMVDRGLRPGGHWDLDAAFAVLGRPSVRSAIWLTVWTSATGTAISVLLGLPAAYGLHRLSWPGRRLVRALLMIPFVLPTVVVGIAFQELLGEGGLLAGLGWMHTGWAIILGLVFFNVAVVIRAVGASWESMDGRPAEAAASLGASPWRVFRTVTWPMLRPSVIGAATVVFLFCATAFGVVLILGGVRYASVETEIYLLTAQFLDLRGAAALSLVQLVVVVLLLVVAGVSRRVADPTVVRVPARPMPLRWIARRSPGAVALSVLSFAVVTALIALPMGTMLVQSLRVDGQWSLANYRAFSQPNPILGVSGWDALLTSLRYAGIACMMALSLGLTIAVAVTRPAHSRLERGLRSGIDALVMLPLGVSAVTLGFGFLITLDKPPVDFRDASWLVPLAQALVALPLVVRTIVPGLLGIDDRQRQAAATLGAGPWRRFWTVDAAVTWRPLVAGAGFAFAASMGEFGATSFLARPSSPTLPVVIFHLLGHPGTLNLGTALAGSVVLALIAAAVMALVDLVRVPWLGAL